MRQYKERFLEQYFRHTVGSKKKLAIIGLILLDMTIYEDKDIGMEVSMNMDRKKY